MDFDLFSQLVTGARRKQHKKENEKMSSDKSLCLILNSEKTSYCIWA